MIGYLLAHAEKENNRLAPDVVLTKIIRSAATQAGIKERIGWHTFRHTYSSALIANGENVKVVQELMRHASSRFTLEFYTQAKAKAKREAQQRIVEMMEEIRSYVEIHLKCWAVMRSNEDP